jgi:serine/threonine-protein kinase
MKVRLEVVGGPQSGHVFELVGTSSFLIGRSPKAHLVLDPRADQLISRSHALLDVRPPSCHATDLGSTNGTFVNGARIQQCELADGDELRIGRTRIRVSIDRLEHGSIETLDLELALPATGPEQAAVPVAAEVPAPVRQTHRCCECGRELERWAREERDAPALVDALFLCPTCAAAQRRRDLKVERIRHYRVLDELGRGGMGVVLKAVDERTRRLCAIKQIRPGAARDVRALRLFEREVGVQSSIRHRNLVRVLDQGQDQGCCFLVAELLTGGDLEHLVTRVFRGPLAAGPACRIIIDVLAGVEALHQHGFVHRDLKPSNMVLSRPYGEPAAVTKVTDYGLAKSFEEAGSSLFDYTRPGEAGGSLMFMPPEQILEYRYVKPPADVYAVGVTLYYLLTARYTVELPTPAELAAGAVQHRSPIGVMLDDPPIPLLKRRPTLPERLARVVDRAVQKDLASRYLSAAELREDLERVCADARL